MDESKLGKQVSGNLKKEVARYDDIRRPIQSFAVVSSSHVKPEKARQTVIVLPIRLWATTMAKEKRYLGPPSHLRVGLLADTRNHIKWAVVVFRYGDGRITGTKN